MTEDGCTYIVVYVCNDCNYRQIEKKPCEICGNKNLISTLMWSPNEIEY